MNNEDQLLLIKIAAAKDEMDTLYDKWSKDKSKKTLGELVTASSPIIASAIKSYSSGVDTGAKAKILAIKAFDTYNKDKGASLSSHVFNQLQPLRRESLKRNNFLGTSERYTQEKSKLEDARKELYDSNDIDPTDDEMADHTGISVKRIKFLRDINNGEISESQITNADEEEGDVSLPGLHKPSIENTWMSYVHHDASPTDQRILEWKTGMNGSEIITGQEIAKRLNLTPAAVSMRAKKLAEKIGTGVGNA